MRSNVEKRLLFQINELNDTGSFASVEAVRVKRERVKQSLNHLISSFRLKINDKKNGYKP